jgi:hypothetical protein
VGHEAGGSVSSAVFDGCSEGLVEVGEDVVDSSMPADSRT